MHVMDTSSLVCCGVPPALGLSFMHWYTCSGTFSSHHKALCCSVTLVTSWKFNREIPPGRDLGLQERIRVPEIWEHILI